MYVVYPQVLDEPTCSAPHTLPRSHARAQVALGAAMALDAVWELGEAVARRVPLLQRIVAAAVVTLTAGTCAHSALT